MATRLDPLALRVVLRRAGRVHASDQGVDMTKAQEEQLMRLAKRSGLALEHVVERWNERAAIREYCGGAKRSAAERNALDDVANEVLR